MCTVSTLCMSTTAPSATAAQQQQLLTSHSPVKMADPDDRMLGSLSVTVIRVSNLHVVTRFGIMDPFVQIQLNQEKKSTRTIEDAGTQAEYNETIRFNIDCQKLDLISFKVKHKTTFGSTTIGVFSLKMQDLTKHSKKKLKFQLVDQETFEDRGTIEILPEYTPSSDSDPLARDELPDVSRLSVGSQPPPATFSSGGFSPVAAQQQQPTPVVQQPQGPISPPPQQPAPMPTPTPVSVPVPMPSPTPVSPTVVSPPAPIVQQQQQEGLPSNQPITPVGAMAPPIPARTSIGSGPQQPPFQQQPPIQQQQPIQQPPMQPPMQQPPPFQQQPPMQPPMQQPPYQQQPPMQQPIQQQPYAPQQPIMQAPVAANPYGSQPIAQPVNQGLRGPPMAPIAQPVNPSMYASGPPQQPMQAPYGSQGPPMQQAPYGSQGAPMPFAQPVMQQQQQPPPQQFGGYPGQFQQQQQPPPQMMQQQPYGSQQQQQPMMQQQQQQPPPYTPTNQQQQQFGQPPPQQMQQQQPQQQAPQWHPFQTQAVGRPHMDSRPFDDMQYLGQRASSAQIAEVRIYAGQTVSGIALMYVVNGQRLEGPCAGATNGQQPAILYIDLNVGERIEHVMGLISVAGLESITIKTNRQCQRYGASNEGQAFHLNIPQGHRLIGWHGSFGPKGLTSIGGYSAP